MQNRTTKHSTMSLWISVHVCIQLSLPVTPLRGFPLETAWRDEVSSPMWLPSHVYSHSSTHLYNLLCLLLMWHPYSSTQGRAFFHHHCLQNHAPHLHHLNLADHPLPCCSSSLRICQNLTSPRPSHLPSLSNY